MRTRIAYLPADEVQHTLALRMAQKCGIPLVHNPLDSMPPGGSLMARLHDLDQLSREQRDAILGDLLSPAKAVPVAVHTYNLGEEQMASLRANGVMVARSLEPTLVRRLCQASEPYQEPVPVEGDRADVESLVEPATLCELIRSLGSQAHRTLTRTPCAPIEEIDELLQQLADLQRQIDRLRRLHAVRFDELNQWVENLLKRVQDRQFEASA